MAASPWLLIARDFIPTGGMDAANLYLAKYLAERVCVEIVAHRADLTGVTLHAVRRPFGRDILGEAKLRSIVPRFAGPTYVANTAVPFSRSRLTTSR